MLFTEERPCWVEGVMCFPVTVSSSRSSSVFHFLAVHKCVCVCVLHGSQWAFLPGFAPILSSVFIYDSGTSRLSLFFLFLFPWNKKAVSNFTTMACWHSQCVCACVCVCVYVCVTVVIYPDRSLWHILGSLTTQCFKISETKPNCRDENIY